MIENGHFTIENGHIKTQDGFPLEKVTVSQLEDVPPSYRSEVKKSFPLLRGKNRQNLEIFSLQWVRL